MKSAKPTDSQIELLTHLIEVKRSAYAQIEAGQVSLARANAALGAFARREQSQVWEKHLRNGKPSSDTTSVEGNN